MKICHVTSAHNSTDIRIFEKECTSLAKKIEYDVFLVAPGESYEKNNVKIVGIGDRPDSRIKRFLRFSKKAYATALSINADVYHLHDPELLQFALKLKKKGKKVIYDSHEDTVEDINRKEYIPFFLRTVIAKSFERFLDNVASKIDAIISVTPRIVNKYKEVNNNVYLVTNYPIINYLKENLIEKKEVNKKVLFFAGGVSAQWSHEYIIDAIQNMDDVNYIFFGPGEKEYIDSLKKREGWKNAEYKGKVPFDVVDKELWKADIGMAICQYVLDKDRTGTLGNTKLFEIMLHGIPVIATDYSLWKEIVEGKNCGICVEPSNIEQIRDAINKIKNNPDMARTMGINGRNAVLREYNWESQERTLYQAYENI